MGWPSMWLSRLWTTEKQPSIVFCASATHCTPLQDSIADLKVFESHQPPPEVSEESKVKTETRTPLDEGGKGIACEGPSDQPGHHEIPVVEAEAHEQSEACEADGSDSDEDVPMPENWGMQRQEMLTSQKALDLLPFQCEYVTSLYQQTME